MYKPDHNIVKKIRQYDPDLFIQWSDRNHVDRFGRHWKDTWEVWRFAPVGRQYITPITEYIYDGTKKNVFTPLDERVLLWLYSADSQQHGQFRDTSKLLEMEYLESLVKKDKMMFDNTRHFASQAYSTFSNNFMTRYAPSKRKPFRSKKPGPKFIKPDAQSRSPYLMTRSEGNARKYFGGL